MLGGSKTTLPLNVAAILPHQLAASTLVRYFDDITTELSPARYIDYVYIDLDCADRAAPDRAKFSCINSRLLFTFAAPDTQGLRYAS
jgi:hypothetical protein